MFGSKLDIFKKEWLDVVFANRNKEYGAYDLRKFAPRATNIGLFIISASVLLLSAPKMFNIKIFPDKPIEEAPMITEVTLEDLDIPEPEEEEEEPIPDEEPPQRIAQEPPAEDLVRFPEPKVVPQNQVKEEVVSQEEIVKENKTPARITLKGTKGASGVPTGEFGPKKVEGQITGSATGDPDGDPNKIYAFEALEVQPDPVGGINAFRKWVQDNYQYPQGAIDAGVKGQIQVSFVIGTDGTLQDIKVVKDLSYGTGQALINVLKKAKPWKPGIQNGRKVKVSYTLPMSLNLQQ
ncbi:energy transducer TonB [Sphingobacterium wenxiniae]|uniref:Outer membrane transport energization protein TonB n=1 Tax=Sphingobacterium wenxiniae TaxID=683125 RepID=A0A1I6ULA7_9SPHI|nr:energy transducer TonB [Sphingobacterium wenxiniae]SFT02266.1 outer membrane transport energization protein TonB [Sphingobacterium wenxiniae]